jgi:hypothetical protein
MNTNDNPNSLNCAAQTGKIFEYMKRGNKITPLEALNLFGCMRLQARIYDIEQRTGVRVKRERVKRCNKFGAIINIMQYSL